MPIDTEQWRASIGLFYASQVPLPSTKCNRPKTEFRLMFDVLMAIALLPLRAAAFAAWRIFVLLSSLISYMPRLLSSLARSSYHNLRCGIPILLALCLVVRMLLIMAGDVETNPGPPKIEATHHPLTLGGLLRFPTPQGKAINIPQQIGNDYKKFGVLLLDDHTGAIVDEIALRHLDYPMQVNTDILQKWIRGEGRQPVSWGTLIDCLRDIGLSDLAGDIQKNIDTFEDHAASHYHSHSTSSTHPPQQAGVTTSSMGRDTEEYQKILTRSDVLIKYLASAMCSAVLANKLRAKKLITESVYAEAHHFGPGVVELARISPMITAVLAKVELNTENYYTFVGVLQEIEGAEDLVQYIIQDYSSFDNPVDLEKVNTKNNQLFEEEMENGHVDVTFMKCIFTGAPGVGKTSVIQRIILECEDAPLKRQSTGCFEKPKTCLLQIDAADDEKWTIINLEERKQFLADAIVESNKVRDKAVESLPNATHPHSSAEASVGAAAPELHPPSSTHTQDLSSDSIKVKLPKTKADIVKLIGTSSKPGSIQRVKWVYLIDTGGQPHFHEVLSAFIEEVSANIFVCNLSESLDHHPQVDFWKDGKQCGEGYKHPLSHRDIFIQCLQTIQSLYSRSEGSCPPKRFVIGTFMDVYQKKRKDATYKECTDETIAYKNDQLYKILVPPEDTDKVEHTIFSNKSRTNVIFPVNAAPRDDGDDDDDTSATASEIRKALKMIMPTTTKPIPLRWYGLELELECLSDEKKRAVFSKDEVLEVAYGLHITEDGLQAALEYLHKLNILLYYPDILPHQVLCNPCVLADKITELIEHSYSLKHPSSSAIVATDGKWSEFCDKGLITLKCLQKEFPKHFQFPPCIVLFTPKDLFELFEKLFIAAHVYSDTYFMPCLLDTTETTPCNKGYPLLFYFSGQYAPCGLFTSLIAFLLSERNKPQPWKAKLLPGKEVLYRNCFIFAVQVSAGSDYSALVTLTDFRRHFQVSVECVDPLYSKVCPAVRRAITMGIKEAKDVRHFPHFTYHEAFYCCQCQTTTSNPHVAEILMDKRILICSVEVKVSCNLEEKHLVWYHGECQDTQAKQTGRKRKQEQTSHDSSYEESVEVRDSSSSLRKPPPSAGDLYAPSLLSPSGSSVDTTFTGSQEDILGDGDLFDIKYYLFKLEKTHIYNLGLALGLSQWKVKMMEDSHTFLDDVLAAWLRREDNVMKRGVPSWRTLVWALKHTLLCQTGVASDICRDKRIQDV